MSYKYGDIRNLIKYYDKDGYDGIFGLGFTNINEG